MRSPMKGVNQRRRRRGKKGEVGWGQSCQVLQHLLTQKQGHGSLENSVPSSAKWEHVWESTWATTLHFINGKDSPYFCIKR